MRSQKSIASWQKSNPSGWLGMVEKSCGVRVVASDCDGPPTDQKQAGCFPANSGEAKLEEGFRDAQDHLNRPFIFQVIYLDRNSDFIPNLQPHCLL